MWAKSRSYASQLVQKNTKYGLIDNDFDRLCGLKHFSEVTEQESEGAMTKLWLKNWFR